MRPGPSPKGLLMKRKILSASAKVFLEKGYAKASSKMVAELLGVSNGSPFFHYGNKEGVLLELVRQMFAGQFRSAERLIGPDADPLLLYAAETAMQMHLAELSEPLRELYVTAYTLPSTSRFIYESMLPKLAAIFGGFLSDTSEQNLRGLELASAMLGAVPHGTEAAAVPHLLLQAVRRAAGAVRAGHPADDPDGSHPHRGADHRPNGPSGGRSL